MAQLYSQSWKDYELLDAGGDKKLERWGDIITIRPERNAYFKAIWSMEKWKSMAHFEFNEDTHTKGKWEQLKEAEPAWQIQYLDVKFNLKLTKFKHLGLFPEQQINWDYIANHLQANERFLNLFGYTGAASLIAKSVGADVFHCDSVKQTLSWGKENMENSGLSDIHWVLEDALKFAQREVKRGKKYKGIVMDPPAFGIGAKKERWKIEDRFPELIAAALALREDDGFIISNTYSPKLETGNIISSVRRLTTTEKVGVDTLCVKASTGKVIEYGQRTLINS